MFGAVVACNKDEGEETPTQSNNQVTYNGESRTILDVSATPGSVDDHFQSDNSEKEHRRYSIAIQAGSPTGFYILNVIMFSEDTLTESTGVYAHIDIAEDPTTVPDGNLCNGNFVPDAPGSVNYVDAESGSIEIISITESTIELSFSYVLEDESTVSGKYSGSLTRF